MSGGPTSEHPLVDEAATRLRAERDSVGPRPTRPPELTVAAIAEAIRAQARRRRLRTVFAAGALAVAAGGAGIWLVRARPALPPPVAQRVPAPAKSEAARAAAPASEAGALTIARAGSALFDDGAGARPAAPGGAFSSGHTLSTGDQSATLTGMDGTVVQLQPRTEIALVRADAIRWFQLQRGTLEAHVSKLAPGNRFVVATPDRQVEVRGTRFRVSLAPADQACAGGTVTRVTVDEGVVTVRAPGGTEDRVAAGQHWPADCATRRHDAHAEPDQRRKSPASAPSPAVPLAPATTPASPSTLAAENDLFGKAARAARTGDFAAAIQLFDDLLARYPASPLRTSVETERARLLARTK